MNPFPRPYRDCSSRLFIHFTMYYPDKSSLGKGTGVHHIKYKKTLAMPSHSHHKAKKTVGKINVESKCTDLGPTSK